LPLNSPIIVRAGDRPFRRATARVFVPSEFHAGQRTEVVVALTPMAGTSLDTYPPPEPGPAYDDRADIAAVYDNLFDNEAVDRIFRGRAPGIELLAVTNKRLMFVESSVYEGRIALTSVPFSRVAWVSFLAALDQPLDRAQAVGIRVHTVTFELHCANANQAREAHDLISWNLTR